MDRHKESAAFEQLLHAWNRKVLDRLLKVSFQGLLGHERGAAEEAVELVE